jgi:hypothetical protein
MLLRINLFKYSSLYSKIYVSFQYKIFNNGHYGSILNFYFFNRWGKLIGSTEKEIIKKIKENLCEC